MGGFREGRTDEEVIQNGEIGPAQTKSLQNRACRIHFKKFQHARCEVCEDIGRLETQSVLLLHV